MNHHIRSCLCIFCLLFGIVFSGCAFSRLKKDLVEFDKTFGVIGRIVHTEPEQKNVIVVLYRKTPSGPVIHQACFIDSITRKFALTVKEGHYFLFAYVDENNNLVREKDEPLGYLGKPDGIEISESSIDTEKSRTRMGLDFSISASRDSPSGFPSRIVIPPGVMNNAFARSGEVIRLDDDILSRAHASKGYWQPLTFLKEVGFRIIFLEPYDPEKTPVLFVHGVFGSPRGWKELIDVMDRERFQPWFFYYPSGLSLDMSGATLNSMILDMHAKLDFRELYVAARSMGGLVARSFILRNVYRSQQDFIRRFITISTPWNGHRMSEKGVKQAPAVVPSWRDATPESAFIRSLFEARLPSFLEYHLLFSYKGNCSFFLENNDGAVELASQLDHRAQAEATSIYGYNETHVNVLSSEKVQARINELLAR